MLLGFMVSEKKNPNGIPNIVYDNSNVMGWHFTDQLRILQTPILVFWEFVCPVSWNKAVSLPEWLQNQFLQYTSCEGITSKKFSLTSWSVLLSLWTSCLIRTQMRLCCISCWWYRHTCLLCKTSRQCVQSRTCFWLSKSWHVPDHSKRNMSLHASLCIVFVNAFLFGLGISGNFKFMTAFSGGIVFTICIRQQHTM